MCGAARARDVAFPVTSAGCCGTPARVADPFDSPDLVIHAVLPVLIVVGVLLRKAALPEGVVGLLQQLTYLGLYAAMVLVLVRIRGRAANPRVAAVLAVVAVLLATWIALHPGRGFAVALARGDHLLCAGFAGAAFRHLPVHLRTRVLVAVSLGTLVLLAGPLPLALVLVGMASGVAAERVAAPSSVRRAVIVQAALMLATLAACRYVWLLNPRLGLGAQGLFAVMLLRHVSWLIDVRRGAGGGLLDYWCFQLFYPCCYGATERYADFRSRNAVPGAVVDDPALFRLAMLGTVYLWASMRIDYGLEDLLAAPRWRDLVGVYFMVFVHGALALMGLWAILQALALAWGMRIHPNFAGILAARSPSQFWHAWRGTMTSWLIEYVYIPLGGNRANQVRNVFVVFAVSAAWHWMGVPFVQYRLRLADFAPIGAWALVNAVVLAAAGLWRRHGWRLWPEATPHPVRTGSAHLATWAFGGVTVMFLGFQGPLVQRFPEFLRRLAGLQ